MEIACVGAGVGVPYADVGVDIRFVRVDLDEICVN